MPRKYLKKKLSQSDVKLSYGAADWLSYIGYSDAGRSDGYAFEPFETEREDGLGVVRKVAGKGDYVEREDCADPDDFAYTIAAPTLEQALRYVSKAARLRVDQIDAPDYGTFFRVSQSGVVLFDSPLSKTLATAAERLFADERFKKLVERNASVKR